MQVHGGQEQPHLADSEADENCCEDTGHPVTLAAVLRAGYSEVCRRDRTLGAVTPADLPMFPLDTVLFPGMALPLHIFEQRYRSLVADCLRGDREFGVVLIERGHEVGGGETRFYVGTVARILQEAAMPDGRWVLLAVGTRRIRIEQWLPDNPYPKALAEDLDDYPPAEDDMEALSRVERLVRRSLALAAELDEGPTVASTVELVEDPVAACWQLCAIAPLGPLDQQQLLEAPTVSARLALLEELASGACEVLSARLSGA